MTRVLAASAVATAVVCAGLVAIPAAVALDRAPQPSGPAVAGAAAATAVRASATGAHRAADRKVKRYKVDLILVKGPGGKDRTTIADLELAVRQVDAFYSRITAGRVRFKVGETHSWVRAGSTCDVGVGAQLAERFGWRVSARTHVVAYQPVMCGFAGRAQQPGRMVLLAQRSSTSAMAHELGHNLGLGHSDSTRCSRAFSKACTPGKDLRRTVDYGDSTDLMGTDQNDGRAGQFLTQDLVGTLNPIHLRDLGVKVRNTKVGPGRLRSPKVVILRDRTRSGYNTASLEWAGRQVWLSYDPGRPGARRYVPASRWYRVPATPQVLVQAKGPVGSTLLLPHTRSSSTGAGLPMGSVSSLGNGVRLQVEQSGSNARVTFWPKDSSAARQVAVSAGPHSASVSWTARAAAAVTGYRVTLSSHGQARSVEVARSTRSATVTGLRAGWSWAVVVRPVRGARAGVPTGGPSVVPRPADDDLPTVTSVTGSAADGGSVTVDWRAPADGWGVLSQIRLTVTSGRRTVFTVSAPSAALFDGSITLPFLGSGTWQVTATYRYPTGESWTTMLAKAVRT